MLLWLARVMCVEKDPLLNDSALIYTFYAEGRCPQSGARVHDCHISLLKQTKKKLKFRHGVSLRWPAIAFASA